MSTIKTLSQTKKEKSIIELNRILSDNITFISKIKGHRFSIVKTKNSIKFYGKKSGKPLTTIDRVLSDLYEQSIHFILNSNHEIFKENTRYGFYFPMKDDVELKPKNNLILTDVTNGTTINIDPNDLNEIADNLSIEKPPIIFNGFLTEKQKDLLLNFDDQQDLNTFIEQIFGKNLKKNTSNIIVRSNYKKYTYFQIGNSSRQIFKKQNSNKFELLLLDILSFMEEFAEFNNILLSSSNEDIRYVEFISVIFNQFLDHHLNYITKNNIYKPDFLNNAGNLTKRYIKNSITLEHIKAENAEYLLRVFLTTFKGKIKARGLISETDAKRFRDSSFFIDDFIKLDKNIDFKEVQKFYFRNK